MKQSLKRKYLVNAFGEDHAADDVLQVGDGLSLEGRAEMVELLLAELVLLMDPLPLLPVVGVDDVPWPPCHPPL